VAERVIYKIKKWSQSNKIILNSKKSAVMPLANKKSKKDRFSNKKLLDVPYVVKYKYLGINIDYTMNFTSTLKETSKLISNWDKHQILGYKILSVTQKLSIWKTYFMSKQKNPIITLILLSKSSLKKISSQTSMSIKKCLGINHKLEKEKLFGWLNELTPVEIAEIALLRTLRKLIKIEMKPVNY